MATQLMVPGLALLPGFRAALERGWSRDNVRPAATAQADLAWIAADPAGFCASLDDPQAKGPPITLPDGSRVARLPGFARWIWDDGFCGAISLRWQPGTPALPPHVLGHIGYAIVPWRRGEGQATRALALLLPQARALGLPHVALTTDPENIASQRVILANGGLPLGRFRKDPAYGQAEGLLFRIVL